MLKFLSIRIQMQYTLGGPMYRVRMKLRVWKNNEGDMDVYSKTEVHNGKTFA